MTSVCIKSEQIQKKNQLWLSVWEKNILKCKQTGNIAEQNYVLDLIGQVYRMQKASIKSILFWMAVWIVFVKAVAARLILHILLKDKKRIWVQTAKQLLIRSPKLEEATVSPQNPYFPDLSSCDIFLCFSFFKILKSSNLVVVTSHFSIAPKTCLNQHTVRKRFRYYFFEAMFLRCCAKPITYLTTLIYKSPRRTAYVLGQLI